MHASIIDEMRKTWTSLSLFSLAIKKKGWKGMPYDELRDLGFLSESCPCESYKNGQVGYTFLRLCIQSDV